MGTPLIAHVASLRAHIPNGNILVVGWRSKKEEIFQMILQGVRGFVSYEEVSEDLCKAITRTWQGRLWFSSQILEEFAGYVATQAHSKCNSQDLTPRQKLIVNAVAKQLSNKEIADELNISLRTVKFHLENVFTKFGVHDRHAVAKLAQYNQISEVLNAEDAIRDAAEHQVREHRVSN